MRHIPIAEFKDRVSEIVAAAEAGEEITITRHGREVVKLIGIAHDRMARQRAAVDAMYELGKRIRAEHGPTTSAEIREWIEDGRP